MERFIAYKLLLIAFFLMSGLTKRTLEFQKFMNGTVI